MPTEYNLALPINVIHTAKRWLAQRRQRWADGAQAPTLVTAVFVGNNRLLVGVDVGGERLAYYLEADDRLITPRFVATGRYEPRVAAFLLRHVKRDSRCLDIGCNFGFFTCLLSRHAPDGRVIGVEADQRIADLARDNVFINMLQDRAEVIHAAVNDDGSDMTLFRRTARSGNTSVVDFGADFAAYMGEPPAERFVVGGATIDQLAEKLGGRVDIIKIDVEGAEPLVVDGAHETIRRNPGLTIVMEWSPGQVAAAGKSPREFAARIAAAGLSCSALSPGGGLRPLTVDQLAALPYRPAIILRPTASP